MSRGSLFDVRVDDLATPYLRAMAAGFPQAFQRALRRLGVWLRSETQAAMSSNGATIGQDWEKPALMTRYRRIPLLKQGRFSERLGRWTRSKKLALRRGESLDFSSGKNFRPRGENAFGSKLAAAVRYKTTTDQVQIGFLNKSAAAFASAVQDGRRGSRFGFEFQGTQPVSENMRRMFWAAGIPLAKDTRQIKEPRRPLIKPLFDLRKPEMVARLTASMEAYVLGFKGKDASAYVRGALGGDA